MYITHNYILQFVIGILSAFPSLAPTAISLLYKPELLEEAGLHDKVLWLPIFYGFLSIIVFTLVNILFPKELQKYWVIGIIIGLIYPTLGTIGDHAKKIYGIQSYWTLYINAQIMYIFLYGVVFYYMVKYICK